MWQFQEVKLYCFECWLHFTKPTYRHISYEFNVISASAYTLGDSPTGEKKKKKGQLILIKKLLLLTSGSTLFFKMAEHSGTNIVWSNRYLHHT